MDLSLRRPDKRQLCAHYVCSVSAGTQGSETLKGRLNVLTQGFQKDATLKERKNSSDPSALSLEVLCWNKKKLQ